MDSKQAFDLNLVNISKIVISDKLKHSHKGFKYFIGTKMIILLDGCVLFSIR